VLLGSTIIRGVPLEAFLTGLRQALLRLADISASDSVALQDFSATRLGRRRAHRSRRVARIRGREPADVPEHVSVFDLQKKVRASARRNSRTDRA
jgi:hypothetical protein